MNSVRLLVVDDEPVVVNGITHLLTNTHPKLEIFNASGGNEAVEILKINNIDILITDIRMPVMDGLSLSKIAKGLNYPPRIVIITGHKSFKAAQRAINIGTTSFILKPIDQEELKKIILELISDILQKRQAAIRSVLQGEIHGLSQYAELELNEYRVAVVSGSIRVEEFNLEARLRYLKQEYNNLDIIEYATDARGNIILIFRKNLALAYNYLEPIIFIKNEISGCLIGISSEKQTFGDLQTAVKEAFTVLEGTSDNITSGIRFYSQSDPVNDKIPLIINLKSWVSENLADADLNVTARHLGLTAPYLSGFFKKSTGQQFSVYLAGIRINRASGLLHQTNLKINQIARQVGYQDVRSFSTKFRTITGMTPSEYRNR